MQLFRTHILTLTNYSSLYLWYISYDSHFEFCRGHQNSDALSDSRPDAGANRYSNANRDAIADATSNQCVSTIVLLHLLVFSILEFAKYLVLVVLERVCIFDLITKVLCKRQHTRMFNNLFISPGANTRSSPVQIKVAFEPRTRFLKFYEDTNSC